MPEGGGGTSVNPATSGAQGLEQYFDQQNRSQAGGFRAPIINIATGGSALTPSISAQGESNMWNTAIIVGAIIAGLYIWKKG